MYGFITALEIRVSETDLAAAIGARSEGADEELSDLADVTREAQPDSFSVSTDENGHMTVSRVVREKVGMDLEDLEQHYRLGYLASDDFDIGDVDTPSLCYMQKGQEYRPAEGDDAEGHYRFVYVSDGSALDMRASLSQRVLGELDQANRTVDALQGQVDQLTQQLDNEKGFLTTANAALQLLREENAEKERVITEAGESINRAAAEIRDLTESNEYRLARMNQLDADIVVLRDENTALRNQVGDLAVVHDENDGLRRRTLLLENAGGEIWAIVDEDDIKSSADAVAQIHQIIDRVRHGDDES